MTRADAFGSCAGPPLAAAALACLAAAPAAAALLPVPHYAEFGSWLLACDNTRRCEARGVEHGSNADLRIVRDAGPATATVALSGRALPNPATLRLDGQPLPGGWPAGNGGASSTSDPAAVHAFITQVRNGRLLTLDGDTTGVPLDGMVAALRRMDDVQGRAGTPSPLVARAGRARAPGAPGLPARPAWHVPEPLMAPEAAALAKAVRTAQARAFAAHDCDKTDDDNAHALDGRLALVILGCMRHAYQSSFLVYTVPRGGGAARPLALPLPTLAGPLQNIETEPGFNEETGTLSSFHKGRGPADCGVSASWVWSGGAFRLTDMTRQGLCGGPEAGDWPTLFRTAPQP